MDPIKIEVTQEMIVNGINAAVKSAFESSYSNPIKTAVEKAITEQGGIIQKLVTEIIANAVADPKVKEKIGDYVISKMVESVMKRP